MANMKTEEEIRVEIAKLEKMQSEHILKHPRMNHASSQDICYTFYTRIAQLKWVLGDYH